MMKLSDLCRLGGMDLVRDAEVVSLALITQDLPGRLVFAGTEHYAALANDTPGVAAVLVGPQLAGFDWNENVGIAVAPDANRAFVDLHNRLAAETEFYGERRPTSIDPTAEVHASAHVDPRGVVIGPDCRIGPGAFVLEGSDLGSAVRLMPGAVVGGIGLQCRIFGSELIDIEHAGRVKIGDRTVVMLHAVIARAVFKHATLVGADCRIGNGAFISHNSRVGPRCLIGHGAIVVGDTEIGADLIVGPGAICLNWLLVGDGARVTAGAVVTKDVPPGARVTGNFAIQHAAFIRNLKRDRDG